MVVSAPIARPAASDARAVFDLSLMNEALGVSAGGNRGNGLRRLAGSWSEDEFRRFEEAVAPFEQIDAELWR